MKLFEADYQVLYSTDGKNIQLQAFQRNECVLAELNTIYLKHSASCSVYKNNGGAATPESFRIT